MMYRKNSHAVASNRGSKFRWQWARCDSTRKTDSVNIPPFVRARQGRNDRLLFLSSHSDQRWRLNSSDGMVISILARFQSSHLNKCLNGAASISVISLNNSRHRFLTMSHREPIAPTIVFFFFAISRNYLPKIAAFCRNCSRLAAFSSSSRFRSSCSMRISSSNLEDLRSCSICGCKRGSVNRSACEMRLCARCAGYAFARAFFSWTRDTLK